MSDEELLDRLLRDLEEKSGILYPKPRSFPDIDIDSDMRPSGDHVQGDFITLQSSAADYQPHGYRRLLLQHPLVTLATVVAVLATTVALAISYVVSLYYEGFVVADACFISLMAAALAVFIFCAIADIGDLFE